jgi:NAD(P)H-hydrate epimerase
LREQEKKYSKETKMKVSRIDEMRKLDRRATEEFGISQEILMENAGYAACSVILQEFGIRNRRFVVFSGTGNNGGDGFVVARKILSNGGEVKVFLLGDRSRLKGSAKKNFDMLQRLKIEIREGLSLEDAQAEICCADAVVDAIFGTGLTKDITGLYKEVIKLINESEKPVFSIDIASGINGDTGEIMGCSIKADYTITFGLPKIGNMLYPGYERGGKFYLSHISFPPSLYESGSIKVEIPKPIKLPERDPNKNKMGYGPVLFIAGAANYNWAPIASAYSMLKAGGGYSYLACPKSQVSFLAQGGREVVFLPQQETSSGSIALENKEELLEQSGKMKMVVMGPGLSLAEETQNLVRELAREIEKPLLIDGDGITAIAKEVGIIKGRKAPTILTPHSGEMARITKKERVEVERSKVEVLQQTCKEVNAIVVLKGPHTLIGYPNQRVLINVSGDTGGKAGMATAGSGDVLNGTIAAMFCLGLEVEEAVQAGVFIHGLAGDLASKEIGPDGMVAKDLLDYLPFAVKYYRENLDQISEKFYGSCYLI